MITTDHSLEAFLLEHKSDKWHHGEVQELLLILIREDKKFHLDDSPFDIYDYDEKKPVFTPIEALMLNQALGEIIECGIDIWLQFDINHDLSKHWFGPPGIN